jgi:hypothetical protein
MTKYKNNPAGVIAKPDARPYTRTAPRSLWFTVSPADWGFLDTNSK